MNELRTTSPEVAHLRALVASLSGLDGAGSSDAGCVDLIAGLETVKRAVTAAQARVTARFAASVRAADAARGLPRERQGRTVAAQVALARRESPHRGGTHVGLADALVHEMPHTLAALTDGRICEWAATVLVRETAVLSRQDRTAVDAALAGELGADGVGVRRLGGRARAEAQKIDPVAAVKRAKKAVAERRVTSRPAPDTMTYVSALLPVADGVAVHAALDRAARTAAAAGDPRTPGQVMADTLVARVTGRDPLTHPVPVVVHLVMSEDTLLGDATTPAAVMATGQPPMTVPATVAKDLLAAVAATDAAFLRRLFTRSGRLVAGESGQRRFPAALARLIALRDQTCATPWCDAPIRHTDHIHPHATGGKTSYENGQGLCARCNQTKETSGWTVTGPAGQATITTPTGHTYRGSTPPLLPTPRTPPDDRTPDGAPDVLVTDDHVPAPCVSGDHLADCVSDDRIPHDHLPDRRTSGVRDRGVPTERELDLAVTAALEHALATGPPPERWCAVDGWDDDGWHVVA